MPTRFRKIRRQRGSRFVGWGQVGQHRKSGRKGGHGKAGLHKHKWSWTVKYAPDHFGGNVFRPPGSRPLRRWMNVRELDSLAASGAPTGERLELDLTARGIQKLLGGGHVRGAYNVHVKAATEQAKRKVEGAGGAVS